MRQLTDETINSMYMVLEYAEKALTSNVVRDVMFRAHANILSRLGLRHKELSKEGYRLFGSTMGSMRTDMMDLISRYERKELSYALAMDEWKSLTAKYYQDMFTAGSMAAGNPYYRDIGIPDRELAFINKARREESGYFKKFLTQMDDPNWRPSPGHPLMKRAGYYAESAKAQFMNGMLAGAGDEIEIYWILGTPKTENCDDCIVISRGNPYTWASIPTMPRACDTKCLFNCTCNLEIVSKDKSLIHPGHATPESLNAVGKYSQVLNFAGQEVAQIIQQEFDSMFSQMNKARQMIEATGGIEQQEYVQTRIRINNALIDKMNTSRVKVTPMVAVLDLKKTIEAAEKQAMDKNGYLVKHISPISFNVGDEVLFVRSDYMASGVITESSAAGVVFTNSNGQKIIMNPMTDIAYVMKKNVNIMATESTKHLIKTLRNILVDTPVNRDLAIYTLRELEQLYPTENLKSMVMGYSHKDDKIIVNSIWLENDGELLKWGGRQLALTGELPRDASDYHFIINHEIGHAQWFTLSKTVRTRALVRLIARLKKTYGSNAALRLTEMVGIYARRDGNEIAAMLYARWKTGLPLTKDAIEFLYESGLLSLSSRRVLLAKLVIK